MEESEFNSFRYWHVPPASPRDVDLPECSGEGFDDFSYWRVPLPPPSELGVEVEEE